MINEKTMTQHLDLIFILSATLVVISTIVIKWFLRSQIKLIRSFLHGSIRPIVHISENGVSPRVDRAPLYLWRQPGLYRRRSLGKSLVIGIFKSRQGIFHTEEEEEVKSHDNVSREWRHHIHRGTERTKEGKKKRNNNNRIKHRTAQQHLSYGRI